MTLDKRRLLIAAAVLVAAAVVAFLLWRHSGDDADGGAAASGKKLAPAAKRMGAAQGGGQLPSAAPVAEDNDPVGDLRLEGQVLGPDDQPVAGALVALGSVPPRTATSEKDGSFEFDKLIGRT